MRERGDRNREERKGNSENEIGRDSQKEGEGGRIRGMKWTNKHSDTSSVKSMK